MPLSNCYQSKTNEEDFDVLSNYIHDRHDFFEKPQPRNCDFHHSYQSIGYQLVLTQYSYYGYNLLSYLPKVASNQADA